MGISTLIGAGITDARERFGLVAELAALRALHPECEALPPGTYVVGAAPAGMPEAGTICTSWHHAGAVRSVACPHCRPGKA